MSRRRAFTIIEMLVVITLVILLVIITLPAFRAMVASQQRVSAEAALTRAAALGHNLALRSSNGRDLAIVFFYEPPGPMLAVACVKAAEVDDVDRRDAGQEGQVRRDVFVPVGGAEPIAFPPGWHVRGYALPATIDNEWYEPAQGPMGGDVRYRFGESAWVFPETGFFDVNLRGDTGRDGQNRQSFMIRYEGGTGRMTMAKMNAALVVSPRPSAVARTEPAPLRADLAQDLERWVNRVIVTSDFNFDGMIDANDRMILAQILGDESGDTILVKPVSTMALYNELELASGLRLNVDRRTGTLYVYNTPSATTPAPDPLRPSFPQVLAPDVAINAWIEGQLGAQPQAKVFTIDRFTGQTKGVSLVPGATP
ncbi:MAG: Tfp pilus assembly protein FimT/FimU [Phycisphaerales bacterium]